MAPSIGVKKSFKGSWVFEAFRFSQGLISLIVKGMKDWEED